MDAHKTASVARVYVPNEYTVYLSPPDRKQFEGYEASLEQEMSQYLLDHARRHDYDLLTRPAVSFETDNRLRLGEFGIQTRLVKPPAREGAMPQQGEEGHTMVYATGERQKSRKRPGAKFADSRAVVTLGDRRYVLEGPKAVLGRGKECDCVVRDPNVSRRHAELQRNSHGDWQVVDLGSTNGVKVNGRLVTTSRLAPGDDVTLGTTSFTFEIEQ